MRSKTPRLSKTKIEYGDYVWNFASGCLHSVDVCPVSPHCWARSITQRFPAHYPQGFKPTIYPDALLLPLYLKKPSLILVCFMGDLFGDWQDLNMEVNYQSLLAPERTQQRPLGEIVFNVIGARPEHTFYFLTKNPKGLIPWSPFLDNCVVGVSVCNQKMFDKAMIYLSDVEAKHKWLSFEPLLEEIKIQKGDLEDISWVVIGGQSNPIVFPKIDWVQAILVASHNVEHTVGNDMPIWIKNNLKPFIELKWPGWKILQERPF